MTPYWKKEAIFVDAIPNENVYSKLNDWARKKQRSFGKIMRVSSRTENSLCFERLRKIGEGYLLRQKSGATAITLQSFEDLGKTCFLEEGLGPGKQHNFPFTLQKLCVVNIACVRPDKRSVCKPVLRE